MFASGCASLQRVAAHLLLASVAISSTSAYIDNKEADQQVVLPGGGSPLTPLVPDPPAPAEHIFTLRHVYHHGTYRHPGLHRKYDVPDRRARVWLASEDGYEEQDIPPLRAKSNAVRIERLADRRPSVVDPMVALARERGYVTALSPDAWVTQDVLGPNITDRETILSLAYITANAYVQTPGDPEWYEIGEPYNKSIGFGWESDGLRGHVWADETNSTVVIGLKGTSAAVFDGDGTTTNDKINDNLYFSCCCAQQGYWTWHQVCDCATGTYSCNNTCVTQSLRDESRYYQASRELYANVSELYPDSNIWLAGHSLGGAVSSLVGLTYGIPVVTFQAVPEALPAGRLGLPVPPGSDAGAPQTRQYTGAFHFGHTADPIYMGTCNGATAICTFGGYAMESSCHTGRECVYDVVGDLGWRVGIGTHRIRNVINDVLLKYDTVPECKSTPECRDCGNWKMYESNGTETTTTSLPSSTSKTRTRTETCKTPGWWGCLDETTTTGTGAATSTSSSSTSTCKTPGWFGCKDKATTTAPTVTTTSTTGGPVTSPTSSLPTSTTTCETPGRFWGCYDTTTAVSTTTQRPHRITSPPPLPPHTSATSRPTTTPTGTHPPQTRCRRRNWLGLCKERGPDRPAAEGPDL